MLKVLITGGNGHVGRGILRRAHKENWDWEISTMSRDESKMVRVNSLYPEVRTIKGDITADVSDLYKIFLGYDIIIHAAANKLVDIGERTAFEVVNNNVIGSRNVAKAAIRAGVKRVVGISTDKAVQPVNTYGTTKLLMERMFQEADTLSDTEFVCARYGNVVGSTISIVLFFEQQLKRDGYIQVTNPEMTRFYMGTDEAIDVILYSLNEAQRGSVVVAKMQAMSVANVARLALDIQNHQPIDLDPRVKIVGERPGEKLHESLLHEQESVRVIPQQNKNYWELRPPTESATHHAFSITSHYPPLGWMTAERMRFLIEDAKNV